MIFGIYKLEIPFWNTYHNHPPADLGGLPIAVWALTNVIGLTFCFKVVKWSAAGRDSNQSPKRDPIYIETSAQAFVAQGPTRQIQSVPVNSNTSNLSSMTNASSYGCAQLSVDQGPTLRIQSIPTTGNTNNLSNRTSASSYGSAQLYPGIQMTDGELDETYRINNAWRTSYCRLS